MGSRPTFFWGLKSWPNLAQVRAYKTASLQPKLGPKMHANVQQATKLSSFSSPVSPRQLHGALLLWTYLAAQTPAVSFLFLMPSNWFLLQPCTSSSPFQRPALSAAQRPHPFPMQQWHPCMRSVQTQRASPNCCNLLHPRARLACFLHARAVPSPCNVTNSQLPTFHHARDIPKHDHAMPLLTPCHYCHEPMQLLEPTRVQLVSHATKSRECSHSWLQIALEKKDHGLAKWEWKRRKKGEWAGEEKKNRKEKEGFGCEGG